MLKPCAPNLAKAQVARSNRAGQTKGITGKYLVNKLYADMVLIEHDIALTDQPSSSGQIFKMKIKSNIFVTGKFSSTASLVDKAQRLLEEYFVTLKLQPGSQWTEGQLSDLLKIGRTPVREAIVRLSYDGLLTVVKRVGITVPEVSIEDQLRVLELRRVIEQLVSVSAALRATDDERKELLQIAKLIEAAGKKNDVLDYLRYHFDIKRYVARAARNIYAEKALHPLHTKSQRFFYLYHKKFNNLKLVGLAHANLARAIASGDEAKTTFHCNSVIDISETFTKDLFLHL